MEQPINEPKLSKFRYFQKYGRILGLVLSLAALGFSFYVFQFMQKNINTMVFAPRQPVANKPLDIAQLKAGLSGKEPALGVASAKLTLYEFADYQCPYCQRFYLDIFPQVKKNYIDTGRIKFVHLDTLFLGKESLLAANAARCAADQGKFWDFHNLLYTKQRGENLGQFSLDNLKKFGQILKLKQTEFNSCLETNLHNEEAQAATALAQSVGVNGTPEFVIGSQSLFGIQTYDKISRAIDQELTKVQ